MATEQKIVIPVELKDMGGSIKGVNDGLKTTRNTLDQIEKLTNKPATKARNSAFGGVMGDNSYGTARGVLGTGASGRDFAKESQGLGGLVRLYATYAANLFAAGAAFRALSNAADTTNMVKGLDQLGAASGKSLGNLSKQLTYAADGAISLRDAMTAVAQSSAAGMSSNNILRMGEVAKRASQALGISMPDAISRLSRGINKLEPELLDELGIFTKIEPATQAYARQLGKTAASLTDFEKRQGFANAVLSEGEQKFNNIKIDANPYDKLLASIQNLTQKALAFVNIGLGPIVKLLSESPVALAAAIAGIANMIIKKALPAIGMWREELKRTADEALLSVTGRSTAAKIAQTQRLNQAKIDAEQEAEVAVTARDEATKRLEALSKQKFSQSTKRVSAILEKPVLDVTPADLKYLNDHAEMNEKTNKKLAASYREVADTIVVGQQREVKFLQTSTALDAARKRLAEGAISSQKDDLEYRNRSQAALMKNIAATAAANAKEMGFVKSLKQAWQDLTKAKQGYSLDVVVPGQFVKNDKGRDLRVDGQKVPVIQKVDIEPITNMARAQGLLTAATAATTAGLAGMVSSLGVVGLIIGSVVGVFEVLSKIFNTNDKQAEKFAQTSEALAASIDNVGRTIDAVRARDPNNIFSIESVEARANAFGELAENLLKTSKAAEEAGKNSNWFSETVEKTQRFFSGLTATLLNLKTVSEIFTKGQNPFSKWAESGWSETLIGGGVKKKLADNLGSSIIAAIQATESGPARDRITKQLSSLVGFDTSTLDVKGLQKALDSLSFSDLQQKADAAGKTMRKFAHEANNNASVLKSLQESLKQTGKDVDALTVSLTPSDPLGKIGVDLLANSDKLNQALRDPTNSLLALKAVADDPKFLSLLPTETSAGLLEAKREIDGISELLGAARENAQKAKEELARLISLGKDTKFQSAASQNADAWLAKIEGRAREAAIKYSQGLSTATFESAFKYLEASLKGAMREGAITAAKGYVSVLAGAGGNTAKLDKSIRDQEFAVQRSLIDAQYAAREAQERNTVTLERANILSELKLQQDRLTAGGMSSIDQEATAKKVSDLTKSLIINENKKSFLEGGPTLAKAQKIMGAKGEPGKEDLMQTAVGQMGGYMAALYGKQAQLAKIAGSQQASNLQAIAEINAKNAVELNKVLDIDIKDSQVQLSKLSTLESLLGGYDREVAQKKEQLDLDVLRKNTLKEVNNINANIFTLEQVKGTYATALSKLDDKKKSDGEARVALTEAETVRVKALAQAEKDKSATVTAGKEAENALILKNKLADIDATESIAKRRRDSAAEIAGYEKTTAEARLNSKEDELNYRSSLGLVTSFQAAAEKATIERSKQELAYSNELLAIENKRAGLKSLQDKIDLAKKEGGVAPKELLAQMDEETGKINAQRTALEATNAQRLKSISLNEELASKMTGFSKIVEEGFQSMADALAEFAKTGKLDFKALVDDMLVNLIRFELRAQMSSLYASGGGLGGMLGKLIGSFSRFSTPASTNMAGDMVTGYQGEAMGGVYDAGLRKFAMGGAFTNSIVDSPTLFKFARGTGLMGEAGPEAIMPLKRDSNGNLGVRSANSGQKVDVVVNNFGSEKATTKETTDSQGNRKIEVIIGEMVSQEVNRTGSPTQQAFSSTFGTRPVLARR